VRRKNDTGVMTVLVGTFEIMCHFSGTLYESCMNSISEMYRLGIMNFFARNEN
jgi:hypothetical protein